MNLFAKSLQKYKKESTLWQEYDEKALFREHFSCIKQNTDFVFSGEKKIPISPKKCIFAQRLFLAMPNFDNMVRISKNHLPVNQTHL